MKFLNWIKGARYDGPDRRRRERRKVRRWKGRALTIWIIVFSLYIGWGYNENRRRSIENQEAKVVFCRFQVTDSKENLQDARKYLHENPHGNPGISVSLIKRQIKKYERRLRALSSVGCDTRS